MKERRGEVPDVYQYDELPRSLRVQCVQIWDEVLGTPVAYATGESNTAHKLWLRARNELRRERGVFCLVDGQQSPRAEVVTYFIREPDTEAALDVVEILGRILDALRSRGDNWYEDRLEDLRPAKSGLAEINRRFREHAVGYHYTESMVHRIDSEFTHEEVVKPALKLLTFREFAGANDEFLSAHGHYRASRFEESLAEALKALESVLLAIAKSRGWAVPEKPTAKSLIALVFDKGLIPVELVSEFSSLRALLESGAPTLRNRFSGHGQGSAERQVPRHLAGLGLGIAAATIVFLVEAHNEESARKRDHRA